MKKNICIDYCDETYGGLFFIELGEINLTLPFSVCGDVEKSIGHLLGFFYVNDIDVSNKYLLTENNEIKSIILTLTKQNLKTRGK